VSGDADDETAADIRGQLIVLLLMSLLIIGAKFLVASVKQEQNLPV